MPYAIKFFRDEAVARWFAQHGVCKPIGYVIGKSRFDTQMAAQREADHINRLMPSEPVTVVKVSG